MSDTLLKLVQELVLRPSITPDDHGCQTIIRNILSSQGFSCLTLKENQTDNLLALHGSGHPFILFLGHTDVVPPGDEKNWTHPPFDAVVTKHKDALILHGRGSADMKGSDAAMTLALADFVKECPNHQGTVGLLLTSNEEGDAKGGTPFVAEYLKKHSLIPDHCLVGEPSALERFGDQIKIGRRGSLSCDITVLGTQGHVAYPEKCDNAAHHAAVLMAALSQKKWDEGNEAFPPTSFQITNIRCGSGAENMAPGACFFMCNRRVNSEQTPQSIKAVVDDLLNQYEIKAELSWRLNGLPFITKKGLFLDTLQSILKKETGLEPKLSTSGGTSDGRFIAPLGCEVVEIGPCGASIHKIDECVNIQDLEKMQSVCEKILKKLAV